MKVPELFRLSSSPSPSWLTQESADTVRAEAEWPFSDSEYQRRVEELRKAMSDIGVAAAVICRPSTIEYLCGFHTVEPLAQPLLVTDRALVLCVPDAELGRALLTAKVDEIAHYQSDADGLELFVDLAKRSVVKGCVVSIEMQQQGVPPRLVRMLEDAELEPVDGDWLAERIRLVLSEEELAIVEGAASATEIGTSAAVDAACQPGATDSSVAAAITAALVAPADSQSAFNVVVATGIRSGIPHSTFADKPIDRELSTFLEFSAVRHRYHAPIMRTISFGALEPDLAGLGDLARCCVEAVMSELKPGRTADEVARRATRTMGQLPDNVVFHWNLGYPIGLGHPPSWMDGAPFYVMEGNDGFIQENMVFHIPASFRLLGRGGVGLSHTVAVTPSGSRALTNGTLEVIEIP